MIDNKLLCSRKKRMTSFIIDRIILFLFVYIIMKNSFYYNFIEMYLKSIHNGDLINCLLSIIYIVLVGYGIILFVYFINFILIQFFTKNTVGRLLTNTRLISYKSNKINNPTFVDLLRRYFYLYLSGLGGLGYFYPFIKEKKSKYDDAINMYVINKER